MTAEELRAVMARHMIEVGALADEMGVDRTSVTRWRFAPAGVPPHRREALRRALVKLGAKL